MFYLNKDAEECFWMRESETERGHCAIVILWVMEEDKNHEPMSCCVFKRNFTLKKKIWIRVFCFVFHFPPENWHSTVSSPWTLLPCRYFAAFNATEEDVLCSLVCFFSTFFLSFFFSLLHAAVCKMSPERFLVERVWNGRKGFESWGVTLSLHLICQQSQKQKMWSYRARSRSRKIWQDIKHMMLCTIFCVCVYIIQI